MMESIEKLRKLRDEAASKMVDNPRWVCARAEEIADEIEREIAENYMELPVDADGVPIHVGDMLECHANGFDGKFEVFAVGVGVVIGNHDAGFVMHHPTGWFHVARYCHHVKPRTLEDVLEEFAYKAVRIGMVGGVPCDAEIYADKDAIAEYAAEIRELMGVSE